MEQVVLVDPNIALTVDLSEIPRTMADWVVSMGN